MAVVKHLHRGRSTDVLGLSAATLTPAANLQRARTPVAIACTSTCEIGHVIIDVGHVPT